MHPFNLICANLRHLRFKEFNDRIRARPLGALLLTLLFGLLPALPWAEIAVADDRVLRVQDGPVARQYPIAVDTETLPWPFQLTEIRRFDRETYFAPARPPAGTDDTLKEGFALYTAHCGKCHRMRGVGGEVGPALDRDASLASLCTAAQLSDYIRHDESHFPRSKMPQFSKLLHPTQIDQVTAYLQAMQPAR